MRGRAAVYVRLWHNPVGKIGRGHEHGCGLPGSLRRTGRVPDFFIVGQPKAGTTALYQMLSQHPEIFMSDLKEPRFLADDMRSRFNHRAVGHCPRRSRSTCHCLRAPRGAARRRGHPPVSVVAHRRAEIAQLQPAARIIAILREPASLLRSLHLQFLRSHVESERDL